MSAGAVPGPAKDQRISKALGRRRHRANIVVKTLCVLATVIGLLLLASILFTLLWLGGAGLALSVFTNMTKPPGSNGGLLNAIVALLALPTHPEEMERYDEEVLDLPVLGFLAMFVFPFISHFRRSDPGFKELI